MCGNPLGILNNLSRTLDVVGPINAQVRAVTSR